MKAFLLLAGATAGVISSILAQVCLAEVSHARGEKETEVSPDWVIPRELPSKASCQSPRFILTRTNDIDFPVISGKVWMNSPVDIHLAVSLHSRYTWLRANTNGICSDTPLAQNCLDSQKSLEGWDYHGPDNMYVYGRQYETNLDISNQNFSKFPVGLAYEDNKTMLEGIGKADGILGIGPGSAFLESFGGNKLVSLQLGDGNTGGALMVGCYLKNRVNGNLIAFGGGNPAGSLKVGLAGMKTSGDSEFKWMKNLEAELDTESPWISLPESDLHSIAETFNMIFNEQGFLLAQDRENFPTFVLVLDNKDNERLEVVLEKKDYVRDTLIDYRGTKMNLTWFKKMSPTGAILGRPVFKKLYLIRGENGPFYLAPTKAPVTDEEIAVPILPSDLTSSRMFTPNNKSGGDRDATLGKKSTKHIIAIAFASAVVLFIITALAVCFLLRRRKNTHKYLSKKFFDKLGTRSMSGVGLTAAPTSGSGFSSYSPPPPEDRYLMNDYEYNNERQHQAPDMIASSAAMFYPPPPEMPEQPFPTASALIATSPHHHVSSQEEDDTITVLSGPSVRHIDDRETDTLSRNVSISTISSGVPTMLSPVTSVRETWRTGTLGRIAAGRRREREKKDVPRLPIYHRDTSPDSAL